uniref:Uncharacterized protein n=1 Tax=Cyanoptyche gloeocystis TaxID=77922 RepID=A0A7S2JMD1_9EUKA|mmetsp:Transcript_2504/g.4578  ORF Transcript_2504/g.4578 Transcript_2504/m.4578 type:complete len:116 (+) Transcript_2504:235-582(+)
MQKRGSVKKIEHACINAAKEWHLKLMLNGKILRIERQVQDAAAMNGIENFQFSMCCNVELCSFNECNFHSFANPKQQLPNSTTTPPRLQSNLAPHLQNFFTTRETNFTVSPGPTP